MKAGGIDDSDDLGPKWADLALALSVCRDALVDLSLALRDHLFEFDSVQRQEAAKIAQDLSEKLGTRVEGSRKS
jgi:hypothetical protein